MTVNIREIAGDKFILWGANWSLYTSKVRPYLIKKKIDYVEINPSHPHYNDTIMKTVGYFTVPVLETPEGDIIADSTEIMEFLEPKFPDLPMLPEDKVLAALAHLIHTFGSEGLTKSSMYLRWNTSYENRLYARNEFKRTLATIEQASGFAVSMRGYLPVLGVGLDHSVDVAIETSIDVLYDALNAHFSKYPYILGGVPSLADYGLMGPLYAHHGRDVASSNRVKLRAPAMYRWIETMLRPPIVDQEVWQVPQEYFSIDELPDTLLAFLKLLGEHFIPEIKATIDLYHDWLDMEDRPAGSIVDIEGKKRCHQALGELEHLQMGTTIHRIGLLDDVMHHTRFQALTDQMNASEKESLRKVLKDMGAEDFADLRLKRDIKRIDYAWVLV
ncbi:MAG: glutathione S-transferase family protein [Deltaproteobacteria bacterium]|jgi:glutathione S-transferase|nr:glutathione S-transferase family protein [Deltaproteobacteria bacterium]